MPYFIEHTDTYGGEANYCWVTRYIFQGTTTQAVKAAKAAIGWTGKKTTRTYLGGFSWEYRAPGLAQVLFIRPVEKHSFEAENYPWINAKGHRV